MYTYIDIIVLTVYCKFDLLLKTNQNILELLIAEEAMNAAIYKLEQGRARIGAVEGEARVVEQYRNVFMH